MLIDWFTVAAQIVNFLVLVWFLKHFLYRPILNAIDEREQKISAQISEAAQQNAEAEIQKSLFKQKNDTFDLEREVMTRNAEDEVRKIKQMMLESADREYADLRAQRHQSLVEEETGLQLEIAQKTQAEVFAIVRKLLEEMASSSLEERMAEAFMQQMRATPPEEMEKLIKSFLSSETPVILRSAFSLSEDQQKKIQALVSELFGADIVVNFETSPELISGIELVTDGYKLAWNMADILSVAGKHVGRILQDRTRHVSKGGGIGHGAS